MVLVISVRNGGSDAYQQVHRVNPVAIDFKAGGNAEKIQQDRRRMLLHRLFDNRMQIANGNIEGLISKHITESFRLLDVPPAEQDRRRLEFIESWPFAPHLLRLLEEQVLIATDAQETRDMIRILANLFKSRGDLVPVLTAADFRLDDDTSGIGALLDSVSNEHHRTLREKAQQNIISVTEAVYNHSHVAPHLQEIIGALWLRSIAVGNLVGAEPAMLQVDITRDKPVDDNAFQAELATIVENSFNIHQDGTRLVFREEENPRAKLMACARNDKLFVDGADQEQLAKQVRYVIGGGNEVAKAFRVIALPKSWQTDPWAALEETEQPERWDDRLPWLLQGAKERGFTLHEVSANASEIPAETNEFARSMGFSSRSQLQNNGGGFLHRLQPAYTECVDMPWKECEALIGSAPNIVFWHHWPDCKVHDGAGAGQGLEILTRDAAEQLTSDDFWSFVERLATGRRLVITSDHGYAATGYFPDADGEVGQFLKKTFSSGRSVAGNGDAGPFVPPVAMQIDSPHGPHLLALGRWKWRSQGGYPQITA